MSVLDAAKAQEECEWGRYRSFLEYEKPTDCDDDGKADDYRFFAKWVGGLEPYQLSDMTRYWWRDYLDSCAISDINRFIYTVVNGLRGDRGSNAKLVICNEHPVFLVGGECDDILGRFKDEVASTDRHRDTAAFKKISYCRNDKGKLEISLTSQPVILHDSKKLMEFCHLADDFLKLQDIKRFVYCEEESKFYDPHWEDIRKSIADDGMTMGKVFRVTLTDAILAYEKTKEKQ